MTQIQIALLLAAAMIAISVLAVFDIVPQEYAQFAPIALIALFPSAWMGKDRGCGAKR